MGEIRILNESGDDRIEWDPNDEASVEAAKKRYDELKKQGYEFFEVTEAKGKRVKRFSKKAGKLIAAPGPQTKQERTTGSRPKALAGGPNATPLRT